MKEKTTKQNKLKRQYISAISDICGFFFLYTCAFMKPYNARVHKSANACFDNCARGKLHFIRGPINRGTLFTHTEAENKKPCDCDVCRLFQTKNTRTHLPCLLGMHFQTENQT
jgi:hypothetical protein